VTGGLTGIHCILDMHHTTFSHHLLRLYEIYIWFSHPLTKLHYYSVSSIIYTNKYDAMRMLFGSLLTFNNIPIFDIYTESIYVSSFLMNICTVLFLVKLTRLHLRANKPSRQEEKNPHSYCCCLHCVAVVVTDFPMSCRIKIVGPKPQCAQ